MRNRCSGVAALIVCAVAAAGCGSGGSGSASSTSAGGSGSTGANTAPPPGSESSKSARQIVADASAALRDAHGYVMQGTITQGGKPLHLHVLTGGPSSVELTFSAGGATAQIIALPTGSYVRGNSLFWTSHLGSRGDALANRWLQVPPANTQSLTSSLGHFAPGTVARCLAEDHGTLTIAGRTTVAGRPAVVIKDAGNAPGSSAGTLAVATTGRPYPLRATQSGPQRAGGHIDACNDGRANDARGVLTFSRFGAAPQINAPPDAVRLGQTQTT